MDGLGPRTRESDILSRELLRNATAALTLVQRDLQPQLSKAKGEVQKLGQKNAAAEENEDKIKAYVFAKATKY